MTMSREGRQIIFECDDCGDIEETGTGDLPEALEHIRGEGWTREHVHGSVWEHYCRSCS